MSERKRRGKVNDKRIVDTVHKMEEEWTDIIEREGHLSDDEMRRSLQRAHNRGEDVIFAKATSTLEKMNLYLCGELTFEYGVLQ